VHNEYLGRPKEVTPIKVIFPPMILVAGPFFTKVKQFLSRFASNLKLKLYFANSNPWI